MTHALTVIKDAVSIKSINGREVVIDIVPDDGETSNDIARDYAKQLKTGVVSVHDQTSGWRTLVPAVTIERIDIKPFGDGAPVGLVPRIETEPNADGDHEEEHETEPDHATVDDR